MTDEMTVATHDAAPAEHQSGRGVLYIDMAYTAAIIEAKKHYQFFEMRHSEGYFDRVVGVHPLADIAGKPTRSVEVIDFSPKQKVIEGVAASLKLPHFLMPFNFIYSQARLMSLVRKTIMRESLDLIVATDAFYSGLFGLVAARLTGRRLAVGIYGNPDELYAATGTLAMPRLFRFRWVEQRIAKLVLSRADLVFAANRNNLNYGIANGARGATAIIPNSKHVEPVHLTAPSDRGPSEVLRDLGIEVGTPVLLAVNRLLRLKHPDSAVRAMAAAIAQRPDVVGLVAGSGPMQAELEALIEQLNMTGRIHLLGHLDQHKLARLLPHCITLSPLTGMALIECGLGASPIVAFDRDWQSEFVEDGVSGFVVPFTDDAAMAARAIELIDKPERRRSMGERARQKALEFADKERIRADEHAVFDALLAREGTLTS